MPEVTFRATCGNHEITGTAVNPGEWFGRVVVVGIACGCSGLYYAIEADNLSDAIDELTDSAWGHMIRMTEEEALERGEDWTTRAGNCGDPVNLDDVRHIECENIAYIVDGAEVSPEDYAG